MILRPCLHCAHKEGCLIKADLLAKIKGAGLRLNVVTFTCHVRGEGFEIGRRVEVTFRKQGYDPIYGERWYDLPPIQGTIYDHLPTGKLRVWLDSPTDQGHLVVRLHPDFPGLRLLNEARLVCKECGRPDGAGMREADSWCCDTCGFKWEIPA